MENPHTSGVKTVDGDLGPGEGIRQDGTRRNELPNPGAEHFHKDAGRERMQIHWFVDIPDTLTPLEYDKREKGSVGAQTQHSTT